MDLGQLDKALALFFRAGSVAAAPCPSPPLPSPGEQAGHLSANRGSVWCL